MYDTQTAQCCVADLGWCFEHVANMSTEAFLLKPNQYEWLY